MKSAADHPIQQNQSGCGYKYQSEAGFGHCGQEKKNPKCKIFWVEPFVLFFIEIQNIYKGKESKDAERTGSQIGGVMANAIA